MYHGTARYGRKQRILAVFLAAIGRRIRGITISIEYLHRMTVLYVLCRLQKTASPCLSGCPLESRSVCHGCPGSADTVSRRLAPIQPIMRPGFQLKRWLSCRGSRDPVPMSRRLHGSFPFCLVMAAPDINGMHALPDVITSHATWNIAQPFNMGGYTNTRISKMEHTQRACQRREENARKVEPGGRPRCRSTKGPTGRHGDMNHRPLQTRIERLVKFV